VALRRLRSLLRLFGAAVACPELTALAPALRTLAAALGPARDWDVFLADTGHAVAEAFPDEPAVAALIAAAGRRRDAAYAALPALLDGPALHALVLDIAILAQARPWPAPAADAPDLAAFGAALLDRRLHQVTRRAAEPAGMTDPALHVLRLKAKRLRYAAEIFAPLHPGHAARRFLKRLAALQEVLGLLNDGVVAAALMRQLAGDGGTGLAGGMVRGFVAAGAVDARAGIARAWRRLRQAGGFWA
jgi:CHAD domain-containing protein